MNLYEVYEAVAPSVVAFISKSVRGVGGKEPLMPLIVGTGFVVDGNGLVATNRHVAEALQQFPAHPVTGEPGYAAVMFDSVVENGDPCYRWMMFEVASVGMINQFNSDSGWFGENRPDIAFVQLKIRGTPALPLAVEDFYVKPGTAIATAGFPMGRDPLTMMSKINQVMPFLRHGIVSSVFPFPVRHPHGFTIDVMQQGGSSGSPIFYADRPVVVGMMASVLLQWQPVQIGGTIVPVNQPTNISIAVPSHMIKLAMDSFGESEYAVDTSGFSTLDEWKANNEASETLDWERFTILPPSRS